MRGDKVRYKLIAQTIARTNLTEVTIELLEHRKRRLAHNIQNVLLGMLGRNLQATRCVVLDNGFEVGRVIEQIVTDTATNKGLLNALHRANLLIKRQQWAVVIIQIGANLRMQTRRAMTLAASILILATHTVHIGRGGTHIREITTKIIHLSNLLNLG